MYCSFRVRIAFFSLAALQKPTKISELIIDLILLFSVNSMFKLALCLHDVFVLELPVIHLMELWVTTF